MGALALASQYELRYLSGQVESPAILRIGQKIFGDAMRISLPNDVDTPLAISVDEAISSLAEQRVKQYHVISLLTDVDTTDWELPKQLNKLYEL
jgi:hypothetical protein